MATPKIPDPKGKRTVIFQDGDTDDIIEVILMGEQRFGHYGKDFCKWANHEFQATEQGLKKLWEFVHAIKYEVDPDGIQDIKIPPALYKIGKGDCKSKTLFVNAVLRCIGVPYKIRFTAYGMDTTVKHVYTIADLNGRKIIMDTVYDKFNQEALWGHKRDYDMPEIAIIEGLPENQLLPSIRNKAYCMPTLSPEQEIYYQAKEKALVLWDEIQQKKKEVPTAEPIEYQNINSGIASLKLLQRELDIIRVMKPEYAGDCKKGLDMIQRALEGDYCITGSVSPYLNRYAQKIMESKNLIAPANSYGLATKLINHLSKQGTYGASIGATFPSRQCLGALWLQEVSAFSYAPPPSQDLNGFCHGLDPLSIFANTPPPGSPTAAIQTWQSYINNSYYSYGSATTSRVKMAQFGSQVRNLLTGMLGTKIHAEQGGSFWFNTKADYDYVIETLNQASGVTSNWLNTTFETNPNSTGTLGSGMFYSFADRISTTGISGFVPANDLPTQVQIKKALQDGFLNSCQSFSGVSFSNIQQLARNGVLFDSGGEQPEYTLGKLWRLSTGQMPSGIGEPISAIIGAIAAAIVLIVAAIGSAVAKANAAKSAAEDIDNNLAATSQFRPPALNQGPNGDDWPLKQDTSGSGSGSSSMLPLAAAGVLGYLALSEK